jgi:hypothetical protein
LSNNNQPINNLASNATIAEKSVTAATPAYPTTKQGESTYRSALTNAKDELQEMIALDQLSRDEIINLCAQLEQKVVALIKLQGSATAWQQLSDSYQTSQLNLTGTAQKKLSAAIHRNAALSRDHSLYYQALLKTLIAQQPLDFDALRRIANSSISSISSLAPTNHAENNLHGTVKTTEHHNQSYAQATKNTVPQANIYGETELSPDNSDTESYELETSLQAPAGIAANQQQFLALLTQSSLTHEQQLQLQKIINSIIHQATPPQRASWAKIMQRDNIENSLISYLPEHIMHKLVASLTGENIAPLNSALKVLLEAMSLLPDSQALITSMSFKIAKWQFIFNYVFRELRFANQALLLNHLGQTISKAMDLAQPQQLLLLIEQRAAVAQHASPKKSLPNPGFRIQGLDSELDAPKTTAALATGIHINNAGLILVAPYLPRLFSLLQFTQDGKFIHAAAADRAVHLLQYIVTGQAQAAEYELLLNKILCGISSSMPISAGIEITPEEETTIQQLLQSIILHWKQLGKTSIEGFREIFLARQGWLRLEEDSWQLEVKEQTFDMLLDSIPWSYSLVKFTWTDKPLYVSWRNKS